jgi:hypothetical protein
MPAVPVRVMLARAPWKGREWAQLHHVTDRLHITKKGDFEENAGRGLHHGEGFAFGLGARRALGLRVCLTRDKACKNLSVDLPKTDARSFLSN